MAYYLYFLLALSGSYLNFVLHEKERMKGSVHMQVEKLIKSLAAVFYI